MTILISIGIIALFFCIPFLMGNVYAVVFRKNTIGIVRTYLSGLAIVYALLLVLQMAFVKLRFDFNDAAKVYNILFAGIGVLGLVCLLIRIFKKQGLKTDIVWSKKAWWIYALIVMQGILYIVLKNPYFENNSLWEITKITMQTGTIYEYNAFTGLQTVAGFPLSNKLMFLPVLYAYICTVFGINVAVMINYIAPVVTFITFYLVMILWIQKLGEEEKLEWTRLLIALVCIVQVGDAWSHSTSFRVLHTGYMGEAIFFGILLAYGLYEIKNRWYLIPCACVIAFPGLVKYDAVIVFAKALGEYWKEMGYNSGMTVLFIVSAVIYIARNKKISPHLLNLNLTICVEFYRIWERVVSSENTELRKASNGIVLGALLLLCGNMTIISGAIEWRSNIYGATKTEYELLQNISEDIAKGKDVTVLAHDNINKWICKLDFPIETVVGYDYANNETGWYSYEEYDEELIQAWESIHVLDGLLMEIDEVTDNLDIDYIILERITEILPIRDNPDYTCVIQGEDYLVYSVDKK